MGVLGLWRLLDATGKPVPLETLEGKVLAIDISIWIHQVIQGYQDRRGNALPNAHLIGLFNRICKLMFFKIKPVFVFDGGVPLLKKNTIATRKKLKSIAATKAQKLKNDLINNLIKHAAVKGALDKRNNEGESSTSQQCKDPTEFSDIQDMYRLPDLPNTSELMASEDYIDSDDEDLLELSPRKQTKWMGNIHSVNLDTEEFKNLPADVRYDILTDLKETRKQNSWGRIHELPTGSDNYSGFQMKRLLKRRYVQESLETAEKEMGGKTLTLEELDRLLTDQGINTTQKQDAAFRIASDSTTRVIYIKDKPAEKRQIQSDFDSLKDNEDRENDSDNAKISNSVESNELDPHSSDTFTDSLSIKSDNSVTMIDNIHAYDLDEDWLSDEDFTEATLNESQLLPKSHIPKSVMNPALAYMLENSGLTRDQILKIVDQTKKNKIKSETQSSHSSIKKGKRKSGGSLNNSIKKRKLFNSSVIKSPAVKREIPRKSEVLSIKESSSESDDFVVVLEDSNHDEQKIESNTIHKQVEIESSSSDSDDFVEIQDVPVSTSLAPGNLQRSSNQITITIKADENLEDDIFADVFSDLKTTKKEEESIIEKPILDIIESGKHLECENTINSIETIITNQVNEVKNEEVEKSIPKGINIDKNFINLASKSSQEELINATSVTFQEDPNSELNTSSSSVETVIAAEVTESKSQESKAKPNIEMNETEQESIERDLSEISEIITKTQSLEELIENESERKTEEAMKSPEKTALVLPVDEKELESMKEQLETEQDKIAGSLGKLERQAIDVTDQMRIEAQELLRLFGVPYVVAPMEAEAQCAYLEQFELTDGTITDDSDIWLFGGRCVYKNFFDNNKRVMQFLSKDIQHHFNLTRKEMIKLALLVGSDYTNGLAGVGPVTALEILASFPSDDEDILRGLRGFSTWFRAGQLAAPGKTTLRNKLKNVQIEKGFPSQAVVQAYMSPTVDESRENFTWSKPNLVLLADYVKNKFGWTKLKFEEIINPVMKKLTESQSQKGIESYFKVHSIPKSIEASLSKRVQTAVLKLTGKGENAELSDDGATTSTSKEKVKKTRKAAGKRGKKSKDDPISLPSVIEVNEDHNQSFKDGNETQQIENNRETKRTETTTAKLEDSVKIKPRKLINPHDIDEVIPQRERDKATALQKKLKAIEIFRKSKRGLNKTKKAKKVVKNIKDDANLSESSDSS